MDVRKPPEGARPLPPEPRATAPHSGVHAPPTIETRAPRVDPYTDSVPRGTRTSPSSASTPTESPGFWSRVKSFFSRSEPKPTVTKLSDGSVPIPRESLSEGWEDLGGKGKAKDSGVRSYKVPENFDMETADRELEALSDELFTDDASEEDKMLAQLEALPSPPKTVPKTEDDLGARLAKLREGYTPVSTEAQLSARLRDLTGANIPKLEDSLSQMSARRLNPQSASPEQIKAQQRAFQQNVIDMTKELKSYLGRGVDTKSKLDASKYAARLNDRIGLESKSLGGAIIQIGLREDIPASQKASLIQNLKQEQIALTKAANEVQQFRFDITRQVTTAAAQKRK